MLPIISSFWLARSPKKFKTESPSGFLRGPRFESWHAHYFSDLYFSEHYYRLEADVNRNQEERADGTPMHHGGRRKHQDQ